MDLRGHLERDVLAWWLAHGPDAEAGGVRTCWDNRGEVLVSSDKYTWSQGRWAWLASRVALAADAGVLGVDPEPWAATAIDTAGFVADHALLGDATTAYLLGRDGTPKPVAGRLHASIYADLFAALGFAGVAQWGSRHGASRLLDRRIASPRGSSPSPRWSSSERSERVETDIASPRGSSSERSERVETDGAVHEGSRHGASRLLDQRVVSGAYLDLGMELLTSAADRYARSDYVCEPYPVPPGRGTHALPMMLLGVGEQLVRAGGGEAALAIVGDALDDLDARYWRGTDAAEVPRLDGRRDDASLLGRHRCPGHLLEAVWFVAHAADLFPDHPLTRPDRLAAVALAACELGWDAEHGGILRYVDRDGGRPRGTTTGQPYEDLVARTWDAKLWWTHAEALYALALVADLTQDADVAAWRDRFTDYTLATFPQGEGREWIQNRNRDGSPLDQVVALPVKDPLHVARALLLRVDLENHPSRHRREDDR